VLAVRRLGGGLGLGCGDGEVAAPLVEVHVVPTAFIRLEIQLPPAAAVDRNQVLAASPLRIGPELTRPRLFGEFLRDGVLGSLRGSV